MEPEEQMDIAPIDIEEIILPSPAIIEAVDRPGRCPRCHLAYTRRAFWILSLPIPANGQ